MKTVMNKSKIIALLFLVAVISFSCADKTTEKAPEAKQEVQVAKQYKMTTQTPPGVLIPDEVDTRLGKLEFFDGVPTAETAQLIWDNQDFSRAVECMIMNTPAASLVGFRRGIREYGPDNETAIWWKDRLDSKGLLLTGNTTVIYLFMWLDTKDGPVVLETPPNVLAIVDDFWFQYVGDVGNAGPDRGKGGKYILLPPGYEGDIPEGHFVLNSPTYGNWFALRAFAVDGSYAQGIDNIENKLKVYPLAEKNNPKPVQLHDLSNKYINTLHSQDITIFEEINEVVQEEDPESWDIEVLGMLRSIGIEKGKPFAPDARMTKILSEAAVVGSATQRAILFRNRADDVVIWPGSKSWELGFEGGSYGFEKNGTRLINARVRFHYYATGITPVMVKPPVGAGSQYVIGLRDSDGEILNGANNYKLHVPANPPIKRFWEATVYDNQTRCMLQTDQRLPGVTSVQEDLVTNADGSWDIYFGPTKPEGNVNWVQTIPNKGWNMLWRMYSPTQVWYDKGWRPGEIELVK